MIVIGDVVEASTMQIIVMDGLWLKGTLRCRVLNVRFLSKSGDYLTLRFEFMSDI